MKKHWVFGIIFGAIVSHLWGLERPNIVLYVADDLGYASVNGYGADRRFVETPNIDALIQQGVQFTNALTTASVCSPTRYAMLTGEYSWRTRLKVGVVNMPDPLLISTETQTLGKFLKGFGYHTAAVGKWHLGYKGERMKNLLGEISPGPNDVGFDYHFGVPNNLDDIHKIYVENERVYGLRSDTMEPYGMSFYGKPYLGYDAPQRVTHEVMDYTAQKAIDWIDRQAKDRPFFLYYSAVAVHHPIEPSDRMRGKSGAGLYGDFIQDVDYSVGQFIEALKERNLYENTIIIFTSDNGGDLPGKREQPESIAFREMGFHFNGQNRGDKHLIYEGGLKVPFIVSWPNHIPAGKRSNALVSTIDIFSTIAEILTGEMTNPEMSAPDSFSFYPILMDVNTKSKRPFLVNRDAAGRKAIRKNGWKLIDNRFPQRMKSEHTVKGERELYHLESDPLEANDLYASNPEVAKELERILDKVFELPRTRY